jgi:hypothetical protein
MPTFEQVKVAARDLAADAGADCSPEYLFWLARDASQRPQDWGCPRSWAGRPNWTANDLRREIAAVLWRLPTHPSRIAPEYRGLPFRQLAAIADGRIEALWADAPDSRTRHEWLVATAVNRRYRGGDWQAWLDSPWAWVARHCPIGEYVPRSRAIAEWLAAKKGWAGWHRPLPIGYGPDGQMRTVRPQDLLDEVWPGDLPNGARSNPERVFRSVMARTGEAELARIAADTAPLPAMPWTTIPGIEQVTSARALVEEGQRMGHCVGGYADACRAGQCYILRLPDSTAEVSPSSGAVYQHRGVRNSDPSPSDKALLARWVASRKAIIPCK